MKSKFVCLLLAVLSFASCQRLSRLPSSTGSPYEVVLVGDTDSVVTHILQDKVEGLPQPEPFCDIIRVKKGHDKGIYSLARIRIVVDVNLHNRGYEVKKRMDVNAKPQLVLTIKAQSAEQLRQMLDGEKLRSLLDSLEQKHLVDLIKQNVDKQKEIKRLFGLDMKIPLDMDASKQAKNFVWYSNNANTGMQNLLIFRAKNLRQIDSVLHRNMLGETDEMYMLLPKKERRGLWEMKGDAMGGPYVMRQVGDVVIIGFVYAPEMKKRNLIKKLEAVLTTIK